MAQGELFGNQLADDDGKNVIRPITMPNPRGSATPAGTPWARRSGSAEHPGPRPKGAGEDAHEGDADLDRREEPARILHQLQGDCRPGRPFSAMALRRGRRAERRRVQIRQKRR